MRTYLVSLIASLGILGVAGCSDGPTVVYEDIDIDHPIRLNINFPYEAAFLYSSTAEIFIFSITEDERGICPVLREWVLFGSGAPREADYESGAVPVCDLIDPDAVLGSEEDGFVVTNVEAGLRAFFVAIDDAQRNTLLSGCTITEVMMSEDPESPVSPIIVRLTTTTDYNRLISGIELGCEDMNEKCTRGCQ